MQSNSARGGQSGDRSGFEPGQGIVAHECPWQAVIAALQSNRDGLSDREAADRLARYGPNALAEPPPVPWWRRLLAQISSVLVVILIVAALISAFEWWLKVPRETAGPYEAIVILAIVVLNAILGLVQEARAERAVEALTALSAPESTVLRDGIRQRVPARDLVPGDILLVEAGDRIPADCRLIETANLAVDEAALTGESLPVTKHDRSIGSVSALGDRRNMIYSGTVATTGRGRAVVVATGMHTELGKIAGLLGGEMQEPTPLQNELDRTGKRLTAAMLAICAIVFATGLVTSPVIDIDVVLDLVLFAVALAVAAIPEALPAVVTVGLSLGVRRMASANAIIRRLPAVETLGAATIICSDKTGTLTRNEMTVRTLLVAGREIAVGGSGYVPEGSFTIDGSPLVPASGTAIALEQMLTAAALANDSGLVREEGRWRVEGDPTEGALVVAARKHGIDSPLLDRYPRIAEIGFTSERKRHATLHGADPETQLLCVKGAPEAVLPLCTHILTESGVLPLDDKGREELLGKSEAMGRRALRVLAIARRQVAPRQVDCDASRKDEVLPASLEQNLVLLGLAGMIDPPREEARSAVATAKGAQIRVIMITGDHPATAEAIARELEILPEGARGRGAVMTGAQLAGLSDAELDRVVEETSVFARVNPEHKLRIVEALQRRGHIVAMTGDGINDAPALQRANIGIAMGITGTDVSKEAADMVLADDNFASIVRAVEEGRAIFDNIRKYLIYLLSSNAGELLTMFAGVMLAGVLGLVPPDAGVFLPLLAVQLLWINLVTDGPPALALGIDPAEPDIMRRGPRRSGAGVLLPSDWLRLGGIGFVMMLGTLFVLDAYYPGGLVTFGATGETPNAFDEAHARTMAFTTLMLFQLVNVFCSRSTTRSAFADFLSNRWLLAALALSMLLQLAVLYVPSLQVAFRTVPLGAWDWTIAGATAGSLLVVTELAKFMIRGPQPPTA
ncbi:MAG: cation-translocating P-type ATPase [Hyphomicrobiaceae bacterium]